jgi:hypothetical protein
MVDYDALAAAGKPAAGTIAAHLRQQLQQFVMPLATTLAAQIDARLVRTFYRLLEIILCFRHRNHGLLLSELGGYLLDPEHAPAGTKRVSNLLRCPKWESALITRFLWQRAQARVTALHTAEAEALLLWDESVIEKPETQKAEGLGAVRSSKAARLTHIKPGFYTPPGKPVFVPGVQWLSLLVLGATGAPTVALMRWWRNRSSGTVAAEDPGSVRREVLAQSAAAWGRQVLHVFDRGYAGSPWLGELLKRRLRFVVRWPKGWHLQVPFGVSRAAWEFTRGRRAWGERWLQDPRRNRMYRVGVLAACVAHPDYAAPLWLVVARSKSGKSRREPWYLLTNEPIETEEDAWRVVLAYARRWQIEQCFRYGKSELGLESPRLWTWERRQKLLLLVTVVYAFLLSLLHVTLLLLRKWLLRYYCHRTGKRSQETPAPLYRLRTALSRLWLAFPEPPFSYGRDSG